MWCGDASAFVSPNCTQYLFRGSQWIVVVVLFNVTSLASREVEPQEEEEVAGIGNKKGRPTHRHTCPFPVSVYYAALILLRRLPPSLERHMFRVKPSFFLSLLKKDERFAQSQTRCHPHQPTEPDDASECFASPRFQINLRLREEGGRGGGRWWCWWGGE